uniref:Aminopeptidase n=1 Tax=Macrostomum lignano TaxID=282301 RepID=A0A1I8JML7_9PLAT
MPKDFKHLPSHICPVHYDLHLCLDFIEFTYSGCVQISIEINEDTDELVLNSVDLDVLSASFNNIPTQSITYGNKSEQTVRLKFPCKLMGTCTSLSQKGTGCLCLNYRGQLSDRLRGFYRSVQRCRGAATSETPCALTMLCPTEARRLLPCWDEPQLKATFQHLPRLTALSNMPEEERRDLPSQSSSQSEPMPARELVRFAKTPQMSTYLLAIVIGRFDCIETVCQDGVALRVFSPIGSGSEKSAVLLRTVWHPLPLPKLDLVAVPELAVGAMENWGLITYREAMLLVDENSSKFSMETVALVVGHEVAHQWFGNLVTMQWWTQLWLNEGFASWVEYLCIDHCYPEFDIDVGHPDEIDETFDAISYSKGAAVIRMLHAWLGEPAFRRGLQQYLRRHSYGNASTADLWLALSEASGQPVQQVMHDWIRRKGFPVISASLEPLPPPDSSQEASTRLQLRLRQSRFRSGQGPAVATASVGVQTELEKLDETEQLDGTAVSGERQAKMARISQNPVPDGNKFVSQHRSCSDLWRVPLLVQLSNEPEPRRLLLESAELAYPLPPSLSQLTDGHWLKLNWQCVGVFRVDYSDQMLDALVSALKRGKLGRRDRFNLQSDLFALVAYGKLVTIRVLEIVKAYRSEQYFTVWSDLLANLSSVQVLAEQLGLTAAWHAFLSYLCWPAFQRLGWDFKPGESHDAGLLRGLLLTYLGQAGHAEVVAEALARFDRHASGQCRLEPDIRAGVYATAARHGGAAAFDRLLALLDSPARGNGFISSEEELRILRALGNTEDTDQIKRVLELSISPRVRQQDTPSVICSLCACGGLKARRLAWQFVKSRWPVLVSRYSGVFLLQRLVLGVCSGLCSAEDAEDLRHSIAARAVKQALETVQLRARLLSQDGHLIAQYLAGLRAAARDDCSDGQSTEADLLP